MLGLGLVGNKILLCMWSGTVWLRVVWKEIFAHTVRDRLALGACSLPETRNFCVGGPGPFGSGSQFVWNQILCIRSGTVWLREPVLSLKQGIFVYTVRDCLAPGAGFIRQKIL